MAISAPIRNCRRLSGYPFSLTREMSIRFFGYFASENERATGVRAISLPGFLFLYPRIVRQTNVPNISVGPSFLSSPSFFHPWSAVHRYGHRCTSWPSLQAPSLVFLTLLFGSCPSPPPPLFPRAGSSTLLSRKLFGFPLFQREIAREPNNLDNLSSGTRGKRKKERDSSLHTEDVSSFGNEPIRVLRSFHCKWFITGSCNCFGCWSIRESNHYSSGAASIRSVARKRYMIDRAHPSSSVEAELLPTPPHSNCHPAETYT